MRVSFGAGDFRKGTILWTLNTPPVATEFRDLEVEVDSFSFDRDGSVSLVFFHFRDPEVARRFRGTYNGSPDSFTRVRGVGSSDLMEV